MILAIGGAMISSFGKDLMGQLSRKRTVSSSGESVRKLGCRHCLIQKMERLKASFFCIIFCAIIGSNLVVEAAGFRLFHRAVVASSKLTQDPSQTLSYRTELANKALFLSAKSSVQQGGFSTIVLDGLPARDATLSPSKDSATLADSAINATTDSKHLNKKLLVTVIVVSVCLVSVILCLILPRLYRSLDLKEEGVSCAIRRHSESDLLESGILSLGPWIKRLNSLRIARKKGPACTLDFALLQAATNNFSTDNLLGRGGFGSVYKARFNDDFFAAVKQLDHDNQKHVERDFQEEVELMSRVRHPNLVSLLGFSIHENRHLLVYELMQNGSLEDQLHGPSRGSALTWNLRMKIALDAVRGLEHLHERCSPPIIHRDFKSSNILLDTSFNAKVSDFGLAIVCSESAEEQSVELQGTFGYVAPEDFIDGTPSEKSDVYAFGVVLLQLITGRKAIDKTMPIGHQSLVTWAAPQLMDRSKLPEMLDPAMQRDSLNLKHLYQVAAIAALCVQSEPSYRPLITDVVNSLVPLVPIELGGALRSGEGRFTMEPKTLSSSETHLKSFSFSDYSSMASYSNDHLRFSMSARMADEL